MAPARDSDVDGVQHEHHDAISDDTKARLRYSIWRFMREGHNIALLNGLTFRDTKVGLTFLSRI